MGKEEALHEGVRRAERLRRRGAAYRKVLTQTWVPLICANVVRSKGWIGTDMSLHKT